MAKYGAPINVDVISGKIGGVVFSNSRSGPTIRVRVRPVNPQSAGQTEVRAAMVKAARDYKNLSAADAEAWRFAATSLSFPNGVGGQFAPSGINFFTQLAAVFYRIDPGGTAPLLPPASDYSGDSNVITGANDVGGVTFTSDAANGADQVTELLYQYLGSGNRMPSANQYTVAAYHDYSAAGDFDFALPAGFYSLAYRSVLITTGQRGPLTVIGTFQST